MSCNRLRRHLAGPIGSLLHQLDGDLQDLAGQSGPWSRIMLTLYRVFFNWTSPEFAKCWLLSNRLKKTVKSHTGPDLMTEKKA